MVKLNGADVWALIVGGGNCPNAAEAMAALIAAAFRTCQSRGQVPVVFAFETRTLPCYLSLD